MLDTPCPHAPETYEVSPDTCDVWCFRCTPARNISHEERERERVRNVQRMIADLQQQVSNRDQTIEALHLKLHTQRLLMRRLEEVNDDLRQQNAHLLDQPLVILNGEAFVGIFNAGPVPVYPN